MAHAAEERDLVLLEAHAGPAPVARGAGGPARAWMSSTVTESPAGRPSITTTRACPWDSPAVRKRSIGPGYRPPRNRPGRQSATADQALRLKRHQVTASAAPRASCRTRGRGRTGWGCDGSGPGSPSMTAPTTDAAMAPTPSAHSTSTKAVPTLERQPAQVEAHHRGQLDVAEAHAAGRDEVEHQQDPEVDARAGQPRSRSPPADPRAANPPRRSRRTRPGSAARCGRAAGSRRCRWRRR